MMIIYTVTLDVQPAIAQDYLSWLKEHVRQMLELPGFIDAKMKVPLDAKEPILCYQVDYTMKDEAAWEHYLAKYAPAMRAQGIERFGEQFNATRALWRVCE